MLQALQEIGLLYFDIPLAQQQHTNPLGEMLSSLFGNPGASGRQKRVLPVAGGPELD
jgi:hypothetical protein